MTFRVDNVQYLAQSNKTKVVLALVDEFSYIPVTVEGNLVGLDNNTLIERATEVMFKQWFVDRAMPEAIQKVDEMDAKLKEVDAFLTKAKEDFQAITEASEMSQGTLVELGEMIFGHEEKLNKIEDRVHALENRNAFGD